MPVEISHIVALSDRPELDFGGSDGRFDDDCERGIGDCPDIATIGATGAICESEIFSDDPLLARDLLNRDECGGVLPSEGRIGILPPGVGGVIFA